MQGLEVLSMHAFKRRPYVKAGIPRIVIGKDSETLGNISFPYALEINPKFNDKSFVLFKDIQGLKRRYLKIKTWKF